MTLLFLAALPVLAYAAFRALRARDVPERLSLVVGIAIGFALTLPPFFLFRSDPPRHPSSARGESAKLDVEFGVGWQSGIIDPQGRRLRWMGPTGEVVVGQLVAARPPVRMSFRAEAIARPRRLQVHLGGRELASVNVPLAGTVVKIEVPPGEGPAVLMLRAEPAEGPATIALLVDSLRLETRAPR